ncbi:MAG: tRNA (guanosine(46)-N7)-methyltransferase TrmB [Bacteroidales bacterium]
MPKNKLKKFTEINSFSNVIQPPAYYSVSSFSYRGKWNENFFQNQNPLVLEIGCGKGEYTIGMARAMPGYNFIGIDIKGDRLWKGAREALDEGLYNVGFLRVRAEAINAFFGENEVQGIWLTFPDPHLRKSRAEKRLTSPRFLEKYSRLLSPGSPIHLKTDNYSLYSYTLEVIREHGHKLLTRTDDLYNDPDIQETLLKGIQTYYEKKFLTENKPICYLKFVLNAAQS